ncbi:MAG: NAD-dependent protein deacetylase [Archaeoglobaceae archaeon]|nr:NAD-dependent protein deacetylase [Archaeoglobaceae archaeon]MCX8151487.1 NAD-dependent protein deacetylase [Archaeoglobaceae archaeon]MDW8014249.1 NAD-dependent protein deacetylase [Archaeoglobaceae archaeon]
MEEKMIKIAAEILAKSKRAVVFTGAGISAESGIPTFRGQNGLWTKYDPEEVASIHGFRRNPKAFWEFSKELMIKATAEPNPAHYAIAELERIGIVRAVITQNVDMLHQKAGSRKVLELHGSFGSLECLDCGAEHCWDEVLPKVSAGDVPTCKNCKSFYVKPKVVLFGEPLPRKVLLEAIEESRFCDTFMVVGSSLVVYPAAELPFIAKRSGANMIIVNLEPTHADLIFDVVIYGKAGEVLPKIVEEVKKLKSYT